MRLNEDFHVNGTFSANTMVIPAGAVGNDQVSGGLVATKVNHEHRHVNGQDVGVNNATKRRVIFTARNAGVVNHFGAGHTSVATGTGNTTVDLYKNGASILTGVITLTSQTVRTVVAGTLAGGATYAAGDVFEEVVVATAGTGIAGQGVFTTLSAQESGL